MMTVNMMVILIRDVAILLPAVACTPGGSVDVATRGPMRRWPSAAVNRLWPWAAWPPAQAATAVRAQPHSPHIAAIEGPSCSGVTTPPTYLSRRVAVFPPAASSIFSRGSAMEFAASVTEIVGITPVLPKLRLVAVGGRFMFTWEVWSLSGDFHFTQFGTMARRVLC